MEIKIGPKPDPCGMPLVIWVALIPEPDNKAEVPEFILFHRQKSISYKSKQTNQPLSKQV